MSHATVTVEGRCQEGEGGGGWGLQDNELGTAELEALVLAVYPPCLPSELRHFQVSSFCCCAASTPQHPTVLPEPCMLHPKTNCTLRSAGMNRYCCSCEGQRHSLPLKAEAQNVDSPAPAHNPMPSMPGVRR